MWLINSSIGRKVVMSVTGIALILFLTFHCAMNIVALFSGEAYNMICELLGANWYAVVATLGLAALVDAFVEGVARRQGADSALSEKLPVDDLNDAGGHGVVHRVIWRPEGQHLVRTHFHVAAGIVDIVGEKAQIRIPEGRLVILENSVGHLVPCGHESAPGRGAC